VCGIRTWEVWGEIEAEDDQDAYDRALAGIEEIPDDEWLELDMEIDFMRIEE
jgi:hypothetical protein